MASSSSSSSSGYRIDLSLTSVVSFSPLCCSSSDCCDDGSNVCLVMDSSSMRRLLARAADSSLVVHGDIDDESLVSLSTVSDMSCLSRLRMVGDDDSSSNVLLLLVADHDFGIGTLASTCFPVMVLVVS